MRYNRVSNIEIMCVEVKRQIVETRVQLDAQKRGVGTFSLFKIDAITVSRRLTFRGPAGSSMNAVVVS